MQPHPDLDLRVHSTAELEVILGDTIATRERLHAWPLSCVELVTTASGRRFVYKVQREPTVEPEFYARAETTLLPECTVLQRDETQAVVLFPFLTAPTLKDTPLDHEALVAHGREIVRQIGAIRGDSPVYRDIGTVPAWRAFVGESLDMLAALIGSGAFQQTRPEDVAFLKVWAEMRDVLAAVDETSQVINGDMQAGHVFLYEDGYRIIDWQRPYRAPGDIDLALLLHDLKIPVQPYVAPAVIGVRWFILIHWALEAQTNLLPHLPFFERWVQDGLTQIRSVASP